MRESGDAELLARYHYNEDMRLSQEREFAEALHASARIQPGLSQSDVLDVLWSMTGSDYYSLLVFQRGWTPSRYEEWLGAALIRLLLVPEEGSEPTTA